MGKPPNGKSISTSGCVLSLVTISRLIGRKYPRTLADRRIGTDGPIVSAAANGCVLPAAKVTRTDASLVVLAPADGPKWLKLPGLRRAPNYGQTEVDQ